MKTQRTSDKTHVTRTCNIAISYFLGTASWDACVCVCVFNELSFVQTSCPTWNKALFVSLTRTELSRKRHKKRMKRRARARGVFVAVRQCLGYSSFSATTTPRRRTTRRLYIYMPQSQWPTRVIHHGNRCSDPRRSWRSQVLEPRRSRAWGNLSDFRNLPRIFRIPANFKMTKIRYFDAIKVTFMFTDIVRANTQVPQFESITSVLSDSETTTVKYQIEGFFFVFLERIV